MVGFGYDVHPLASGESLVLGGVVLESRVGTVAHSDGDVLVHAIMDALLGALALGDIGLHFPDTHPEWLQMHRDGRRAGRAPVGPLPENTWQWLCMNSPYAEHVSAVTDEVLSSSAADGLFFDIVKSVQPGCCCTYCLRGMAAEGVNPEDDAALHAYTLAAERRFMERLSREAWAKRRYPRAAGVTRTLPSTTASSRPWASRRWA